MTKPDTEQAGESPSQLIDAGIKPDRAKLFTPSLDGHGVKALIRPAVRLDTSASERRSR